MRWISFFLVIAPFVLEGQTINLAGTVAIQNSQYETGTRRFVDGVRIRAAFAKPVVTDAQGTFVLEFQGVALGTPMKVNASKIGFEVVNTKELGELVLGRKMPTTIVMADPARLAEARLKYYGVATGSITASFERKLKALRAENASLEARLAQANASLGTEFKTIEEASEAMYDERDNAFEQANTLADEISRIDLDGASRAYRQAIALFEQGKLDSVLLLLSEERLEEDYTVARKAKDDANAEIRQVFQSLSLKVKVLQARLEYDAVIEVLGRMQAITEQNGDVFTTLEQGAMLKGVARSYFDLGRYERSASVYRSATKYYQRSGELAEAQFAECLVHLGDAFREAGVFDSARVSLEEAIALYRTSGDSSGVEFANALHHYALICLDTDKAEEARRSSTLALDLLRNVTVVQQELFPEVMSALGQASYRLGDIDQAFIWFDSSITRLMKEGGDKESLAGNYKSIGELKKSIHRPAEGLSYLHKAKELELIVFGHEHPRTAATLNTIGLHHMFASELDSAQLYINESIGIRKRILGPQHPDVGKGHGSLAALHSRMGDQTTAIIHLDTCIAIARKVYGENSRERFNSQMLKSLIESRRGRPDSSLRELDKAMEIGLAVFGPSHDKIATVHTSRAWTWSEMGMHDSAMMEHRAMAAIILANHGEDHPLMVSAHKNQAITLQVMGDHRAAIAEYEHALRIMRLGMAADDPEVYMMEGDLAGAMFNAGDKSNSEPIFRRNHAKKPSGQSSWYLHLYELEAGHPEAALDLLIICVKARSKPDSDPKLKEQARSALKEVATRLGRDDILLEYDLK